MENKIPIYRQIEQYIMNNIEDGIYAEGMMIVRRTSVRNFIQVV